MIIRYTSNDIIKRAEQLADLENSDFISEYEKLALLNESFQRLYQEVINSNDKIWIRTTTAYDGMELPADFYQLSALYLEHSKEQINKKNDSQNYGYEIKNNRIYFSHNYDNLEIVMEYWPMAPAITIREKTIDSPYNNSVIAAGDNLFVYLDDLENITVADIYSDTVVELGSVDQRPFTDIAVYSNGILLKNNNQILLYRFDTNEIGAIGDKIPAISQNTIYLYDVSTKSVIDLNYNLYRPALPILFDNETTIIYFNDDLVYQVGSNFYICNAYNKVEIGATKLKCALTDKLYAVSTAGKLWRLNYNGIELVETQYPAVGIVSDKYVLTNRAFGNVKFLEGLMESTVLDYPNNLFFVTLSYMLAIQFKIKQSADITALTGVYREVKNQFFDSLNRDANQFYQIKNVYRGRNWIYG